MTGRFTAKDPVRCAHYARFFKHLTLAQAEIIFWLLFTAVLILMSISSIFHHKSAALTTQAAKVPDSERKNPRHPLNEVNIRRTRVVYLAIVSLCLLLSASFTVIECFAAFNIEYCDGEDLMQLYWGFWSILQVGSNIAILGVMLQFWIVLGDVETPSWAVALGTPVLVFAAAGFIVKALWGRIWSRCFPGKKNGQDSSGDEEEIGDVDVDVEKNGIGPWISQAPTIRNNRQDDGQTPRDEENESRDDFKEGNPTHATSFWSRDLHYLVNSIINDPASPSRPHAERHPTTLTGEDRSIAPHPHRQGPLRSYSLPL